GVDRLCGRQTENTPAVLRRNDSRQQSQRRLEHEVRVNVVNLSNELILQGYTVGDAADLLKLQSRTLRHWQAGCRNQVLQVHVLGRPLLRASVEERNQVIDLLHELGPPTGLPTCADASPPRPGGDLEALLRRYRRVWKKLNTQLLHRLRWPIPGRVWAMDFADAPRPIDGLFPHLLAVRDLASGQQLLW